MTTNGSALASSKGTRRRWLPLVLFLALLLPAGLCAAASQQIQVTWAYSGSTVDLAGFRLYKDASLVCSSNDPASRTLTCTVDLGGTSSLFTMTAFDVHGAESFQSTAFTLTPQVTNQAPSAVANANVLAGPAPLAVFFNGSSSNDPDGYVASYAWNFGDGTSAVGVTVDHTYALPGLYSAVLTVTDDSGASAQGAIAINVGAVIVPNQSPAALMIASTSSGVAPLAVTFDGSRSTDADGSIASYSWNFGDGGLGSGALLSHSFTAAGSYTVTLTVTDNQGATAQVQKVITVQAPPVANKPPVAALSTNVQTGTAPLAISFNGSGSSDQDGTIASYSWNFGDGSTATGQTAQHTYGVAGSYTATMTVTDNQGAAAQAQKVITVAGVLNGNKAPKADFSVEKVWNPNKPQAALQSSDYLTIVFDGSVSSDDDGDIVEYIWDFGDGYTGIGSSVTHTYAEPSAYTVTLSVKDNEGAIASIQKIISLSGAAVANAASFSTTVNTELQGFLEARDPQGFELVYTITSQASKGTAMLLDPATGAFVYTPQAGFSGTDSFSFKASSNGLDSNVATVTISVTAPKSVSTLDASTTSGGADAGGGGGCSLAVGDRSPTQAADWFVLSLCLLWLAKRRQQRQ